jgi:hypothetical protein
MATIGPETSPHQDLLAGQSRIGFGSKVALSPASKNVEM